MDNLVRFTSVTALFFLLATGLASTVYADDELIVRRYDVSQDGNTFKVMAMQSDPGPFDTITDDGHPAQGAMFSVLGYVYPFGTLKGGTVSGTNGDGSPAFPELVLGTWSCRGWFILDGDPGVSGEQLIGTQTFVFFTKGGRPGQRTIVSEGIDLSIEDVDLSVPFVRPITGGTGTFLGARGRHRMTNFGFNESFGFDSTHRLVFSVLDID
ncbi:MAG: hypothetical protein AAF438_14820 [Pseudomonadota bacterium]